jgi:hypothetical protein
MRTSFRCKMVRIDSGVFMPITRTAEHDKTGHRLSITVNDEQYAEITALARKNRVSIAWIVREAVERLLADDQPLFKLRGRTS